MEAVVKLKPVSRSPATLQYLLPKPTATGRPIYKRRFYPNEDVKESLSQPWMARTDPMMPPYPYGKSQHFEEANHGLYGGATIQTGNKISDGRNKGRTLRKWYPNVRVEKLKSRTLNVELSIPTVARVMRTIRKCGGLDEYLLGEKPARIKELGLLGWKLRWLIMKNNSMKERHSQERLRLGVPATLDPDAAFQEVWADSEMRQSLIQKMHTGWQQLREKDSKFLKHWKGDEKGVRDMKSLKLYDPKDLKLPEIVEEEFIELPEVQTGFGIIDTPTTQALTKGQVIPDETKSSRFGKAVNKAPGRSREAYEGGQNSAVLAPSFKSMARTERARTEAEEEAAVGGTSANPARQKKSKVPVS